MKKVIKVVVAVFSIVFVVMDILNWIELRKLRYSNDELLIKSLDLSSKAIDNAKRSDNHAEQVLERFRENSRTILILEDTVRKLHNIPINDNFKGYYKYFDIDTKENKKRGEIIL